MRFTFAAVSLMIFILHLHRMSRGRERNCPRPDRRTALRCPTLPDRPTAQRDHGASSCSSMDTTLGTPQARAPRRTADMIRTTARTSSQAAHQLCDTRGRCNAFGGEQEPSPQLALQLDRIRQRPRLRALASCPCARNAGVPTRVTVPPHAKIVPLVVRPPLLRHDASATPADVAACHVYHRAFVA